MTQATSHNYSKAAGDTLVTERDEAYLQRGAAGPASVPIRVMRGIVRSLFNLFFKVRVFGLNYVPEKPVIVCANHLGWADPFLVLLYLPVEPRIYILGERRVKYISAFRRFFIEKLRVMVALDRDKPREALAIMEDVLKRGGSLLLFPEGTLGTQEGALGELQHGAAHLSAVSGVSILPVGLTGTRELWLRRTLVVRIGAPLSPANFSGDTRTRTRAITTGLAIALKDLLPGDTEHGKIRPLRRWLTKLF